MAVPGATIDFKSLIEKSQIVWVWYRYDLIISFSGLTFKNARLVLANTRDVSMLKRFARS